MFNDALKSKKISHDHTPWFPMPKDSEAAGSYIIPKTSPRFWLPCPRNNRSTRRAPRSSVTLVGATGPSCRDVCESITICVPSFASYKDGEFVIDLPAEIMKTKKGLSLTVTGKLMQNVNHYLSKQFHVQGEFVFDSTNYRMEWNKACARAGLRDFDEKTRTRGEEGGARLHGCQCSGAVNLLRAGIDEGTVLKIGRWKTRAMLDRHNAMDEWRIAAGLKKGGDFVAGEMIAPKDGSK